MAKVSYAINSQIAGVPRVIWSTLNQTDEIGDELKLLGQSGLAGSVHVYGTFSTGTLTMKVGNTGVDFTTLKDLQGLDVAFTAAGYAEFSTSAAYIRPELTGAGAGDDITVIVILRG